MFKKLLTGVVPLALCGAVLASCGMKNRFLNPPDSARPGVYWYFMDGNLNGKEMTADLESMKAAGLGNLVFLEVDIGMPKGPVRFMSEPWQERFVQTVRDAERLGIDITLGIGPGWCGSGGPWVKPEQSMQHLVFSSVELKGPQSYSAMLPVPEQRSTEWHTMASPYYEDVVTWAFPSRKPLIADIDEKALYLQGPVYPQEEGQALSAGFGELCGAGAVGRPPAGRDRGSHRGSSSRTERSTGMSPPGNGRSSAWAAGPRARAAGPRLPPGRAWSATSSTRRRWRTISTSSSASCWKRSARGPKSTA